MASSKKRTPAADGRTSKANAAYEQIREQIVEGAYPPGTRLVLDRLARELDMSTLPVREAIRRLEAEGYVQFKQNVGATVAALDADSFVQALETFAVLESAAIAQSAAHLTAADLTSATSLNEQMAKAIDGLDRQRYAALHDQFHVVLTSRCPNTHLANVVANERDRLQRVRLATLGLGEGGRREVEEHRRLLELIKSGAAGDVIEDLCRAHVAASAAALVG
jgi:DNA-binding GntR family transcriptional regulator